MKGHKKHICHISTVHLALDTRIFYRYCQTLKDSFEVSLIACHPKKETIRGVEIIPYKRYKNRIFRTLFSWLLVLPKCLKQKADLYHLHDPELIPLAIILKTMGKKVVYDIHENIAQDIFDKDWIKFKSFWYALYNLIERPVLKRSPIILAEKSYLDRYSSLARDVTVIYNYCDIEFFEPLYKPYQLRDPHKLFYSGILLLNRGILEIAEALYLANLEGKRYEFHCVAELYTQVSEALTALPYWNEIKDQITFYGRLSLEKSYEVAKQCGIGLCIIHPMNNSIKSYPTKLFEYMAVGLPSISSNFPLYKSVLEHNNCGITVNPNNAKELSKAIINLTANSSLLETFSKNGKKAVALRYNWKTEAVKLMNTYQRILN